METLSRHAGRFRRVAELVFWLLTAAVLLYRLGDFPLEDWDEAIYAEVIQEMLRTGDFLTMHYNHDPYYNKPPLYFWLGCVPMWSLGFNEFTSRLPGVIFGALALFAAVRFGTSLGGWGVGLTGGLLLLSSAMFLENGSRHASPDGLLLFCTVAALWSQWESRRRPPLRYATAVLAGAAFMTKGAAALSLWAALLAVHVLLGDYRRWRRRDYVAALALLTVVIAPWYLLQTLQHGLAFWQKHVYWSVWQRAVESGSIAAAHVHGPLFYIQFLAGQFIPFWPIGILALSGVVRIRAWDPQILRAGWRSYRESILTLAVASAVPVLLFSAAQNKTWWYVLPAVPPLCIAAALVLCASATCLRRRLPDRLCLITMIAVLAAMLVRQGATTLASQIRNGLRGYGALVEVAESVPNHAAALGMTDPVVVSPRESPTVAVYVQYRVIVDPDFVRHLEDGTLRNREGRGVMVLADRRAMELLAARKGFRILEARAGQVLGLVGEAK